jgi:hypothetical protein
MKYKQNYNQHTDAVLVILNSHGMTQKKFTIQSALKILGMRKEPEMLQKCLLRNQLKIYNSLSIFD